MYKGKAVLSFFVLTTIFVSQFYFSSLNSKDINSSWQNRAETNISDIFEIARNHDVAVIFLDEIAKIGSK